jgi:hypothetical protein
VVDRNVSSSALKWLEGAVQAEVATCSDLKAVRWMEHGLCLFGSRLWLQLLDWYEKVRRRAGLVSVVVEDVGGDMAAKKKG